MRIAIAWGIVLALPLAAAASEPQLEKDASGARKVVTGEVVDSACYMIHAGSGPTHKQCARNCAAAGLPLAIRNEEDGALYFAADGNAKLLGHIARRVTAKGLVTRKSDPLALKMPAVGGMNEINLKVDGGYNVLEITSIVRAPAGGKPKAQK